MGIGSILIERGLITDDQLEQAIAEQQRSGERLDQLFVRLGFVNGSQVLEAIGQQFAMPIVDLNTIEVKDDVLRLLPPKLVFKQRCAPIEVRNGVLRVATCDPFELTTFDELRVLTGMSIELVLADERDLRKFIRTHYGVAGDTLDELGPATAAEKAADLTNEAGGAAGTEIEQAQEASVIKLVNDLLLEAIRERATDVHIEPYEDALAIRYRVDGVLAHAGVPPTVNRFRNAIISRLKIMANLNIAEKRKPQDGRITLRHKGQEFDLRVSVIPMLFGEGVVLRILNKHTVTLELAQLGMDPSLLQRWDGLIARPHGILLVTGPTGSGKSTTLYASLRRIVSDEVKAITVEDPVEYHVDGVNQIQVQPEVGLTFATGLRSILRHDPDIIMIGEIRDRETAEAAVQASLTGHLVFSTLHTNDASGAMTRLLDMGVEPFLVASSVEGVMAQRLVRRVCADCRAVYQPEDSEFPPDFGSRQGLTFHRGLGCRECRNTGFKGRLGIYELLTMTEPIRELVVERANTGRIEAVALASGDLTLLRPAGFEKVRSGDTTIAEVLRATKA
ncbi:MAG TPA: ATPase, T2SS/T4P/T4SS family [Phycisphaerales bacterium]|nr:ATPase, T2SS/T4P/T4SS family [Phycisphaerales bacterium]